MDSDLPVSILESFHSQGSDETIAEIDRQFDHRCSRGMEQEFRNTIVITPHHLLESPR